MKSITVVLELFFIIETGRAASETYVSQLVTELEVRNEFIKATCSHSVPDLGLGAKDSRKNVQQGPSFPEFTEEHEDVHYRSINKCNISERTLCHK